MRLLPCSLFGRLVLAFIVYGVLVALAFAAIVEFTHARFHLETSQRRALGWAGAIAARYQPILEPAAASEAGRRAVASLLTRLGEDNPGSDFYLIGGNGTILAASRPLAAVAPRTVDTGPIRALLSNPDRLPVLVDDPSAPGESRVFSAAAVGPASAPAAWFVMLLRGAQAPAFLTAHALHRLSDSLALAAGVTIPALAIASVILFMILQPMRRISASIASLELGQEGKSTDFATPIAPRTSELDHLGRHVDAMVQRIGEFLHRQRDNDRQLREMFSHLSHDLRTPLAVLDGCLDALMRKDERMDAAERQRLLRAAATQSRSLGRLVDSIFALARLQRPDYQLEREPFCIAEAVHDIALKFAARAQDHAIALEVTDSGRHLRVDADVLLVERVLDNLIDNAIRHARGATRIAISLRAIRDGVEVSVSDDGPGLPPAVAARFATHAPCARRFPRSVGGDLGLGLGIVCRILELHGTRLELVRSGGAGVTFRFVLTIAADEIGGSGSR